MLVPVTELAAREAREATSHIFAVRAGETLIVVSK
jgi:hypothetical protein